MRKLVFLLANILFLFFFACDKEENDVQPIEVEYGEVSDIDGNIYKTIIIGSQEWLAENLKTTKYNDGTTISHKPNNDDWNNSSIGAYAWYNNDISNKDEYGALYNWYAVDTEKLCPIGWRVPSHEDWQILEGMVDSKFGVGDNEWSDRDCRGHDVGKKLKTTNGWHNNENGTDAISFAAKPGGYRYVDGSFFFEGKYTQWWNRDTLLVANTTISSTHNNRIIVYNKDCIITDSGFPLYGHYMRCVTEAEK